MVDILIYQRDFYERSPFGKMGRLIVSESKKMGLSVKIVTAHELGIDPSCESNVKCLAPTWFPRSKWVPRHYILLPFLLREIVVQRPKVVIGRDVPFALPLFLAVKLSGIRCVKALSLHLSIDAVISLRMYRLSFIYLKLLSFVCKKADRVFPVSFGILNELRRFIDFNPNKVKVVRDPVFSEELLLQKEVGCSEEWLNDSNRKYKVLIYAGRLAPEKRVDLLILALCKLNKYSEYKLLVLGDGVCQKELQELSKCLGVASSVKFVGRKDNPFPFIYRSDILVLCSDFEGLSNILIQGLAMGVRIVSSDCPHGPSEVLKGGELGCLFEPGSVSGLVNAILKVQQLPFDTKLNLQEARKYSVRNAIAGYLS